MRLSIDLTGPAEARFKAMLAANDQLGTAPLVKAMFSAIFGPDFLTTTPLVNDSISDANTAALVMSWSLLGQRPNLVGPDGVGTISLSMQRTPAQAETLPPPPPEVKVDPRLFTMRVLESPVINERDSLWFFEALCDANASLSADQLDVVFNKPSPHDTVFVGAGDTTMVNVATLAHCFNFTVAGTVDQPHQVPYIGINDARLFVRRVMAEQGHRPESISAAMMVVGAMLNHAKAKGHNFTPFRGLVTMGEMLGHAIVWLDHPQG